MSTSVFHTCLLQLASMISNLSCRWGLVAIYSGPRALRYDGAVSELLQACGAVIAGCSAAATLAKHLLLEPLTKAVPGKLQPRDRSVVDDISVQRFGPPGSTRGQLPVAAEQLLASCAALRPPVNMSKCNFLVSDPELASKLREELSLPLENLVNHARNLGTDVNLGGLRRVGITASRWNRWRPGPLAG